MRQLFSKNSHEQKIDISNSFKMNYDMGKISSIRFITNNIISIVYLNEEERNNSILFFDLSKSSEIVVNLE